MKYFFDLACLFFVQQWDAFDRFLCVAPPWYVRLPWCSLWVRNDPFHPSLSIHHAALFQKKLFYKKWLKAWQNVARLRPRPTEADRESEQKRITALIEEIDKKYYEDLDARKKVVRNRYSETPS